jgi:hypothetical protein
MIDCVRVVWAHAIAVKACMMMRLRFCWWSVGKASMVAAWAMKVVSVEGSVESAMSGMAMDIVWRSWWVHVVSRATFARVVVASVMTVVWSVVVVEWQCACVVILGGCRGRVSWVHKLSSAVRGVAERRWCKRIWSMRLMPCAALCCIMVMRDEMDMRGGVCGSVLLKVSTGLGGGASGGVAWTGCGVVGGGVWGVMGGVVGGGPSGVMGGLMRGMVSGVMRGVLSGVVSGVMIGAAGSVMGLPQVAAVSRFPTWAGGLWVV